MSTQHSPFPCTHKTKSSILICEPCYDQYKALLNDRAELIGLLEEALAAIKDECMGPEGMDYTGTNLIKRLENALTKAEGK